MDSCLCFSRGEVVECLPRWRRGGIQLERIEVWVEGNVVPCTRYFHAVCDAVAEGFPVVGYANEGSLNACEAEALVLQVAALFDDDPFIVLTETKLSFRCIPVGIGTLLTGLGSRKNTCDNVLTMTSTVPW